MFLFGRQHGRRFQKHLVDFHPNMLFGPIHYSNTAQVNLDKLQYKRYGMLLISLSTIRKRVVCKYNCVYLPHGLGFLCSRRGSNLLFPAHCELSNKLVGALIVTGEIGAETLADNNSKTIQYIFPLI